MQFELKENPFIAEKALDHSDLQESPVPDLQESPVPEVVATPNRDPIVPWRKEIDSYYHEFKNFDGNDPAKVFLTLAACSARASEIRNLVSRSESRRLVAFVKKEIDPFLDECERQFRFHSRALTVREQEIKLNGASL